MRLSAPPTTSTIALDVASSGGVASSLKTKTAAIAATEAFRARREKFDGLCLQPGGARLITLRV